MGNSEIQKKKLHVIALSLDILFFFFCLFDCNYKTSHLPTIKMLVQKLGDYYISVKKINLVRA